MSKTPKTKREASTFAKRLSILDAAIRLFVEKGFHAASIRDIAAEAGISLGNLYNHFSGKSALIEEIAALEAADLDRIEAAISRSRGAEEALDQLTRTLHGQLADRDSAMLTAEIMAESLRNPAIADRFSQNRTRLIGMIVQILRVRGVAETEAPGRADAILDLIEGDAFRQVLDGRSDPDPEPVCALVRSLAAL